MSRFFRCILCSYFCIYFVFNSIVCHIEAEAVRSRPFRLRIRALGASSPSFVSTTGSSTAETSATGSLSSHSTYSSASASASLSNTFVNITHATILPNQTNENVDISTTSSASSPTFQLNDSNVHALSNAVSSKNASDSALITQTTLSNTPSFSQSSLYNGLDLTMNDTLSTASTIQINRTSVFGFFKDGDIITLEWMHKFILFRCDHCYVKDNTFGYTGSGSRMAMINMNTVGYNPGRLSQFTVEVVSVDNANRKAVIRLRTDDATYIRSIVHTTGYKAIVADSIVPGAGSQFTILPNLDGTFLVMDEVGDWIVDGGIINSDQVEGQVLNPIFSPYSTPISFYATIVQQTDNSFQQMSVPWLKSGSMAPFSHGDPIIIYAGASGLMTYRPVIQLMNYTTKPISLISVPNAIVFQNSLSAQWPTYSNIFRAYYQGDPSDGIFRMTLLDGTHLHLGPQGGPICETSEAFLLVANGTEYTTDWQMKLTAYGWKVEAVANNGNQLTLPLDLHQSRGQTSTDGMNGATVSSMQYESLSIHVVPPNQVKGALLQHDEIPSV